MVFLGRVMPASVDHGGGRLRAALCVELVQALLCSVVVLGGLELRELLFFKLRVLVRLFSDSGVEAFVWTSAYLTSYLTVIRSYAFCISACAG